MNKEHMKHLMLAKKHLKTYMVHSSKGMLEADDDDLKKMYEAHHDKAMKMAEETKMHLKRLDSTYDDDDDDGDEDEEGTVTLSDNIKALTGKEKVADQLMVLTAYKNAIETVKLLSEQKTSLEKEVIQLKEKFVESEKIKLIDEAISGKKKKLFPSQRTWALSQTLEQLKVFLEATPALNVNEKIEQPTKDVTDAKAETSMKTFHELLAARGVKITVNDEYEKVRKEYSEKLTGRVDLSKNFGTKEKE